MAVHDMGMQLHFLGTDHFKAKIAKRFGFFAMLPWELVFRAASFALTLHNASDGTCVSSV